MKNPCVPALLAAVWSFCPLSADDPLPLTTVSSATYRAPVARGSIASSFGRLLAIAPASAATRPLPTDLGRTTVTVRDSAGVSRPAGLFFVSPSQVNFLVPPDTAAGAATVTISNPIGRSEGTVQVTAVAPGIYTANMSGSGTAAGFAVTGSTRQITFQCAAVGSCSPVPLSGTDLVVELYGTGIRYASTVTAAVAGQPAPVLFSGAQQFFDGLDQVNIRLPANTPRGVLADVEVTADGRVSNRTVLLLSAAGAGGSVRAVSSSIFPADSLTVPDAAQRTGRRVNLPLPDCAVQPSTCTEIRALNELDGFNVQPQLMARFSGPVDTLTLRDGVFLMPVAAPRLMRLNRLVYDPAANTLYGKPDEPTVQSARYAVVVTDAVKSLSGQSVEPDAEFAVCTQPAAYCSDLARAITAAAPLVAPRRIVGASVFTTLSAASWLERARDSLAATPPAFRRPPGRNVFEFDRVTEIKLRLQNRTGPDGFTEFSVPLPGAIVAGASRLAFGSYSSPNFLDARQIIPATPSAGALPPVTVVNEIQFHAVLPSGQKPAAGYPVVIFGHGLNDSSFGAPTLVAGSFAREGLATLSINAAGHGNGPLSRVLISEASGQTTDLPAGGRSVDLDRNGFIESREGCVITEPIPIALRDCLRQTTVDLMQLVRAIRAGMDLDGDGSPDLDVARIYFAGQSMGSLYGAIFTSIDPFVRASVLNVGGAPVAEIARWSESFEGLTREFLTQRTPPLSSSVLDFRSNFALRDQPVKIADSPGLIDVQNFFERLEWLHAIGDPFSYAAHMAPKRVLFQFARGDRTVPNPATSNLIRQAGGRENSVIYRHDLAAPRIGGSAVNPHPYLVDIRTPAGLAIALATQAQMAEFLMSDGTVITDANNTAIRLLVGTNVFERPAVLPEDLGF